MENIITVEELIEKLELEYPDKQPRKELSGYEQGKLVGAQQVIDYIKLVCNG